MRVLLLEEHLTPHFRLLLEADREALFTCLGELGINAKALLQTRRGGGNGSALPPNITPQTEEWLSQLFAVDTLLLQTGGGVP